MTFQSHCESLGINLLRDDINFIKQQLLNISKPQQKAVLQRYADRWLEGMSECDIVYRKQNIGRLAANTNLREYVNGNRNS